MSDLFAVADPDKDGVITASEARSAAWQGARSVGRAAFDAADTDRSGTLNEEELQAALRASARAAFGMSDTNGDGQLTEQEASIAMRRLGGLVGVRAPTK